MSATAWADDAAPATAATKVGVVPFSAVGSDVPPRAGVKSAALLANEIKNTEALQWVEPKPTTAAEPNAEGLAKAKALFDQGMAQRARHQFRLAEDSLRQSIAASQAAAASLTDVAELQDAWVSLAAVQYNTGRDEEGQKSLLQAIALAPNRELPLAKSSPLFTRVVTATRAALASGPKGNLSLESTPPAAAATLDGVAFGVTPLLLRNLPPGTHLWRLQLPSGDVAGGAVEVQPNKTARANAQLATQDPASRLNAELSQNKLSATALAATAEAGKAMGADAMVVGGLVREGKDLELHAFLVDVARLSARRLAPARFDPELLSAGMAMYSLIGEVEKKGREAGEPAPAPCPVVPRLSGQGPRVVEVDYGLQTAAAAVEPEGNPEPNPGDEPRSPAGQKGRKPLTK